MIKAVFCFLSLFVVVVYSVSDETLLEQHYTQVAQFGLQTVFGENQFVVRVKPVLSPSNYKVRYTKQSNIRASKKKRSSEKVYLLPGYPALKNLAPGQLNQYPFDSVTTLASPKLKKIFIYLVVNKALSRSKIRQARLFLKDLLGLDFQRDEIKIKYRPVIN